ncbi:hypothetical protein [Aeromicrobium sp. 9AM]|uniref:hypothetical protein n=1 Tax=Aeromicrobium sp. 9AM TaxID=2653126 RepID=UPI0012F18669|nr:hypothetical protein [Aeromicrobium sp. 9AM]VXC13147.1 conserved hypothetical protein [Aeromicrobium sp. 9AM]
MKPSERHEQHADLMTAFRHAYVDLINSSKLFQPEDSFIPRFGPASDHSSWQAKYSAVSAAAGAASRAYRPYGGVMTLRNAAVVMNGVDPVANWEMSLKDPKQLPPESVLSAVEAAVANASQQALEARQRERGITGLIAAFLRWPSNLREAVGPGRGAQRAAAGFIGLLGQIFVGAIGAALSVGIVAGSVALWRLAF